MTPMCLMSQKIVFLVGGVVEELDGKDISELSRWWGMDSILYYKKDVERVGRSFLRRNDC